jgi:protein-L-isoaspartate O-methyltransferase
MDVSFTKELTMKVIAINFSNSLKNQSQENFKDNSVVDLPIGKANARWEEESFDEILQKKLY